jgi:GNAT superfamily N-acetyltransferase
VNVPAGAPRAGCMNDVEIVETDPADRAARYCLRTLFAELDDRFDQGFDVVHSISANDDQLRRPAGLLLIAHCAEQPVGCGALVAREGGRVCDIKRMWVAAYARGIGLGRRLLTELEARASGMGARQVQLETNRALAEAINLYRSAGYVEVPAFSDESYAHHWFVKRLR